MKKKIINYGSQYIDDHDIQNVVSCLKSNFITQGPFVKKFERGLKKYFKSKYAVSLSNGTAALYLAIKSLKLKKSTCILTTPITFISSASSILMNNHLIDFVDIDRTNLNIDPNLLEHKLKKNSKIKAVVAVDFAGNPCDWEALNYLKKKYEIFIINDNCHSMGSEYLNDKGYAAKYADIVTQSYHAVKTITTGEGGAILTNNKKIYNFINDQKTHGMIKNRQNKIGLWHYYVKNYGYNFRLSDIQCALGISQLQKINEFVLKRRILAKNYFNLLSKYDDLIKLPNLTDKKIKQSFHLYPIQINFKKLKIKKKNFF